MSYYLYVDRQKFTWPDRHITAAQIRDLVSVPQEHGVWQVTTGATDPAINASADLEDHGGYDAPRFFTGPRLITASGVSACFDNTKPPSDADGQPLEPSEAKDAAK